MTPNQAIALLEQVTGMLQLNRQDHSKIQEAIEILKSLLPKEESKK